MISDKLRKKSKHKLEQIFNERKQPLEDYYDGPIPLSEYVKVVGGFETELACDFTHLSDKEFREKYGINLTKMRVMVKIKSILLSILLILRKIFFYPVLYKKKQSHNFVNRWCIRKLCVLIGIFIICGLTSLFTPIWKEIFTIVGSYKIEIKKVDTNGNRRSTK